MQEIFRDILKEIGRACEEVCCKDATVKAELSQGTPIQMFAKEYGHGLEPPVPYVRNTVEIKTDEWRKVMRNAIRQQFANPKNPPKPSRTIQRLENVVYKDIREAAKAQGGFSQQEVDKIKLSIKVV